MSKTKISPRGSSWDEFEKQFFIPEEIAESELRVAIIEELIKAREESGITQKELENTKARNPISFSWWVVHAMSGIKQPVISRIEKGMNDPQFSTVVKLLNSLGKTLQIVPMK